MSFEGIGYMGEQCLVASSNGRRGDRMHIEQCQFWFLASSTEVHEMIVDVLLAACQVTEICRR